jgi:type III secretory pathway component EscR
MMNRRTILGVTVVVVSVLMVNYFYNINYHFLSPEEKNLVEIGKEFLDEEKKPHGKYLSIRVEEEKPNFYLNTKLKYERPELQETRDCWIIRYKKGLGYIEVWIDYYELLVVGGVETR